MEQSNVSFRRESQSAINLPGTFLFSSSEVIVTEKGISAPGNRIFYSNTGGKFNCSIQYTKTGWMVWYLTNSYIFLQMKEEKNSFFFRKYFTPFSIDQLVKGDKTVLWFDRAAASMQIGDRLKNVAENIKSVHIESKKEKKTHLSEEKNLESFKCEIWQERAAYLVTRDQIFRIFTFSNVSRKMKPSSIFIGNETRFRQSSRFSWGAQKNDPMSFDMGGWVGELQIVW